jgi:hypothetical protein
MQGATLVEDSMVVMVPPLVIRAAVIDPGRFAGPEK